ncbi:hypothetical protein EUTSA_v10024033mg [Eutrema salsugineum]|uniref:TFIIS N-terminal domain-containing protein n=1 Tax=Eutrema salsugineum TaxID=72664 RepID=V4JVV2_EUTSA|nr:uncharacterized protein LOC18010258 [Eutrema salsugineum]ESQ29525.1 hypothetical protein EUTSA_v10024033mg [Eutrema salsugineum]
MAFSEDFPPEIRKDVKRRSRKRRMAKKKDLEELISVATRAAHVARDKGFYIASPEAIQCVEVLRIIRSLPLTPRLITKTDAFRALQFLAKNGNPKIRSESKSVVNHWKRIFANEINYS